MPQVLTISFVPDGTPVGTQASNLSSYASKTWGSGWERAALQALEAWVTHAGINVGIHTDDGEPLGAPGLRQGSNNFGDIRVAAVPMANDVLASAVPFEPAAGTWSGDVLLNSAYSGPAVDAYSVFLHELGHVFGFSDNLDPTSVNYRYFSGQTSDLSASDIVALQNLYGARQPDAYEGATGNNNPSTAAPLTFQPGENSQSIAADIMSASDVDFYQVTLPTGSNELQVSLKASGLSLLTGILTVFDAGGTVVGTASTTDPGSNDLTVLLAHASPGQTYRISVRAADSAFGVGQYALSINTDAEEASTPPSAFLGQYGSTELLSILTDGASSNPTEFQDILRLMFAGGGSPSLYSDNVKDELANYLAQAGSSPQASQSVGTLLIQILAAQGSSQLDPGQYGAVLGLLNQSGVMKQVVSDLVNSGAIDQVVGSLISSGQMSGVLQNLIDSGALANILHGAIDSPQGPALLAEISGLLLQTFGTQSGAGTVQAGPPALTSHDMLEFYTILLDNNELDPVIDSFLDSGLLYNSFASVSPEVLLQSFMITMGLAAQPDELGADLRQFFAQSGMTLAPGPVTPEESVAMIRALRATDFFDEYYRALMNAGGLDAISVQLAASGALDQVFTNYLTSQQVSDLFGAIVKSDLLPELARTGVLDGMIRSAIDAGAIGPLLENLNELGALPGLTVALLDTGTTGPLFDALLTSDNFTDMMIQMFEAGQLGPIAEALVSSGALADAINGLVSSGQFPEFFGDVLSIDSPAVISALDDLAKALLPTPATTFDDALPLAASTASAVNGVRSLSAVGVLGDAHPLGIYKVVVPRTQDGAPATMIVGAWRQQDTLVQPEISIFDAQHRPVAFQLLNNDDGDYVVQVLNPTPGQVYYVMVREASTVGTAASGVFGVQAIFGDEPIQMDQLVAGTMGPGTQQVETPFVATDSRIYHWVLTSDSDVTLTVVDSSGRSIQDIEAPAGEGVSIDLLLDRGTYTLVFTRQGQEASPTPSLRFTLSGFELSDLMKPYPTDPSLQPVGTDVGQTFSSSPVAGGAIATAVGVTGLAIVDPASHSFMATFGNQGGIGSVNVTIARGPGGPLNNIAVRGQDFPLDAPKAELGGFEAGEGPASQLPTVVRILVPIESAATTKLASVEVARSTAAEGGGAEELQPAADLIASLPPPSDPNSPIEGPEVRFGQDHRLMFTGVFFVGGTTVGLKLRKKYWRASRGHEKLQGGHQGTPTRPARARRASKAGWSISPFLGFR